LGEQGVHQPEYLRLINQLRKKSNRKRVTYVLMTHGSVTASTIRKLIFPYKELTTLAFLTPVIVKLTCAERLVYTVRPGWLRMTVRIIISA